MRPERNARRLFGITQSKARMYEYSVPQNEHIRIPPGTHPEDVFALVIGIVGDEAAALCDRYLEQGTLHGNSAALDGQSLRFSAAFFYAYVEAKFNAELDEEFLILAATTFYLAETPGSSAVVSRILANYAPQPEDLLATALRMALLNRWSDAVPSHDGRFARALRALLAAAMALTSKDGADERVLLRNSKVLREQVYRRGSAREIAFVDMCTAVVLQKVANSSRFNLPHFSRLDEETWSEVLNKPGFFSELWPAQRLLGTAGVFSGASAVVQMPTSAGKTRAVELLIRSSILSGRANTAIIVAPFRALCSEISSSLRVAFSAERVSIDELSDVLQQDFLDTLAELLGDVVHRPPQIIVLTPEKLLYVLRQAPQIAERIGLVVYDEGHQFDTGARGVTYELLLTTLKLLLPKTAQKILISAVISNGETVGRWLVGPDVKVVDGKNLLPTQRSVAFASWQFDAGTLQFEAFGDPQEAYFVPRVIEPYTFPRRPRERKAKLFPGRTASTEVALYLGLKLASQGSVAIFCGLKASVAAMIRSAVEYFGRGLPFSSPAEHADGVELEKLVNLHVAHFGEDAVATRGARLGLLAHHGATPQGLRLSIEHAVKEGLVPFVVCTSTLAQGVNLPLRYLIVSTLTQGGKPLTTRDFQNLIGRAGRAGMHIEGSVIFADTQLYDKRRAGRRGRGQWNDVRALLDVGRIAPTQSSLLELIDPILNDDNTEVVQDAFDVIVALVADEDNALAQINDDEVFLQARGATTAEVARQVRRKAKLVNAVASFLQASRGEAEFEQFIDIARDLAKSTLAYSLATEAQREQLVESFVVVARAVQDREPDTANQTRNSRTLLGLNALAKIYRWCTDHGNEVLDARTEEELLATIWPILAAVSEDELFERCVDKNPLLEIAQLWLAGHPYHVIGQRIHDLGIEKRHGQRTRSFSPEDVVDICDNCFGYEFSLYLTALVTFFEQSEEPGAADAVLPLKRLQSGLKYGLPDALTVAIQETGFADRMLAQELRPLFGGQLATREAIVNYTQENEAVVRYVLTQYPSYFEGVLDGILKG